jgi:putative hemolysin
VIDDAGRSTHIIDDLLVERAPHLLNSPLWPLLGPLRDALFGYRKAIAMADAIQPLSGRSALAYISDLLRLDVHTHGIDRLPASGSCIAVVNHPTGIADGIAVYDAIRAHRPDVCFFANADARRVCPRFDDVLIPVEWPASKRTMRSTKETLALARAALHEQRALVIFPAGVMSRRLDGMIQDPPWEHSAVALARRHRVPILPMHLDGPYSFLFHLFGRFSQELRNITVFHEFLNKVGGRYRLTIGAPVDVREIEATGEWLTRHLKSYVEQTLPSAPDQAFEPPEETE